MSHLVSVIMPAFNAAKYLAQSIDSVRCQSFGNWELIVIDDGSEDNTLEIAQSLSRTDARIKVISQPNGGQASARNAGLKAAQGDLIAFLDADDLWVCDKLARQIATMEDKGADLIFSDGEFVSDDGELDAAAGFAIVPGRTEGAEMFRLLFERNRIATLSVLLKASALNGEAFDPERKYQNCEDYDLWLSLAKRGAIFYGMPEKLMKYRRHSQAATFDLSKMLKPMLAVIMKHSVDPALAQTTVRTRIRWLYRELISALVRERKVDEAKRYMRAFAEWDKRYLTYLQRMLLTLSPGTFNYLSREVIYRAEWHLGSGITSAGPRSDRVSKS